MVDCCLNVGPFFLFDEEQRILFFKKSDSHHFFAPWIKSFLPYSPWSFFVKKQKFDGDRAEKTLESLFITNNFKKYFF